MRLGICGKATRAAWICISWAKSLSKVGGLAIHLLLVFKRVFQNEKWCWSVYAGSCPVRLHVMVFVVFQSMWFEDSRKSRVTATTFTARSREKDWAAQSDSKTNKQKKLAEAAVSRISLLPPLIHTLLLQWMTKKKKKNPLFNHQWQSLTQIARRRLHAGLGGLLRPQGFMIGREKVPHDYFQRNICPRMQWDAACGNVWAAEPRFHCYRWWSS